MILDERLEFADAANLVTGGTSGTGAAGTTVVGDVINLGSTTNYIGDTDDPLWLVVDCVEQALASSAGTIQFFLVSDVNPSLSNAGTAPSVLAQCTEHLRSVAATTDTNANIEAAMGSATVATRNAALPNSAILYRISVGGANPVMLNERPPFILAKLPGGAYEQYLGVICTIASPGITTGKVNAYLTRDVSKWRPYANAI